MSDPLDAAALAQLAGASGAAPLRLASGLLAVRCGRNEVWRIETHGHGTIFAKVHRSPEGFERERYGLELACAMAAADDRFGAAHCLQADRSPGILVTAELPGIPVSKLIRDAYRIDRNPLRTAAPRRLARRAIEAVLSWMEAFHRQPTDGVPLLHDHSHAGIAERVNRKLRQRLGHTTFAQAVAIPTLVLPQAPEVLAPPALQFGDPSLENFRFDGRRIGAVDFEDIGIGIRDRDYVILRNRLTRALALPYYLDDPTLVATIPVPSTLDETVVQIELELLRYEREALSPGPMKIWRMARQARRLRRAASSYPELVAGR